MVFRHGAVLGLSELATVVGSKGLGSHVPEVRRIPVSALNLSCAFILEKCQ